MDADIFEALMATFQSESDRIEHELRNLLKAMEKVSPEQMTGEMKQQFNDRLLEIARQNEALGQRFAQSLPSLGFRLEEEWEMTARRAGIRMWSIRPGLSGFGSRR
jgi:hypothetical protein